MKHLLFSLIGSLLLLAIPYDGNTIQACRIRNFEIEALLDRIGGDGTSQRFEFEVDPELNPNGKEVFILSKLHNKPYIKGNTILAVTTGINWYLNHYAHVNLSWNRLTTDLTKIKLPLPETKEKHECSIDYRYYLNYCTFSYSMSVWTWERWEKEIDWMALHGINMPLQIVGLDVVWKKLLVQDLGYTLNEANDFIAGPCFQAWWGMNNLEGWGGPNPEWWYERQELLAKKIVTRQRSLGMQPVLPGYSGMVPSSIIHKGYTANDQGHWCSFVRPYILDPNSDAFNDIAKKYYKRLKEVMGTSTYYSMDPFHEGANTTNIDVPSAYSRIALAMKKANPFGKWVIQYWQWGKPQYQVLKEVKKGDLLILDLFSDAHSHFSEYEGHEAIYCMLPNFGGRTGLFGRLNKVMEDFYKQKARHQHLKGIGTTPEAIEQCPVLYDVFYELPWYGEKPEAQTWIKNYTIARYGTSNLKAQSAWEKIRMSALNCPTTLQGPHEAVFCARPALKVDRVSSWGGTNIFYDPQDVIDAAFQLAEAGKYIQGDNYSYDLADFTRQALTDYAYYLLKGIETSYNTKNISSYKIQQQAYLQLILDLDELLCTNANLMVGNWLQMARDIANESDITTNRDKDWLEYDNARTLITTWGQRASSENGGLRDYSYRAWGGLLKDYYYQRWAKFFECLNNKTEQPDWFQMDWDWAHNPQFQYNNQPTGNTIEVAKRLLKEYFVNIKVDKNHTVHLYRHLNSDIKEPINVKVNKNGKFTVPIEHLPQELSFEISLDFNKDGYFSKEETFDEFPIQTSEHYEDTKIKAILKLSDRTQVKLILNLE